MTGPTEHDRRTDADPAPPPELTAADVQRWLAYERTHLANERTYAAWLRSGLSVAAVGVALAHFLPEQDRSPVLSLTLGTGFVVAGVALIGFGAWRYGRTHRHLAISGGRTRMVGPGVVYGLTAGIVVLLVAVLLFV